MSNTFQNVPNASQTCNPKKIDYLDEDAPIQGQLWCCISFLSPEGIMNCSVRGLKIRGVYPTRERANERAKELSEIDPDFDVFVGEVGKWLPWDPDPNSVEDQQYQQETLQQISQAHKDNLKKSQRHHKERTQTMINTAAQQEQSSLQKRQERLRKKLEQRKAMKKAENKVQRDENKVKNTDTKKLKKRKRRKKVQTQIEQKLKEKEKTLKVQEKMVQSKREKLMAEQKVMETKKNEIQSTSDKLARMKQLYNERKEKEKQMNA